MYPKKLDSVSFVFSTVSAVPSNARLTMPTSLRSKVSFRDVVVGTNDYWSNLTDVQKEAVVALYKRFEGNMKYWGLDKVMSAAQ